MIFVRSVLSVSMFNNKRIFASVPLFVYLGKIPSICELNLSRSSNKHSLLQWKSRCSVFSKTLHFSQLVLSEWEYACNLLLLILSRVKTFLTLTPFTLNQQYADDVGWMSTAKDKTDAVKTEVPTKLRRRNLNVNESKTEEYVTICNHSNQTDKLNFWKREQFRKYFGNFTWESIHEIVQKCTRNFVNIQGSTRDSLKFPS